MNYPNGTLYDSNAPWNQSDSQTVPITIKIEQTVTKQFVVNVEECKVHPDFYDGYYWNDYTDCDLMKYFKDQHYSVDELFTQIIKLNNDLKHASQEERLKLLSKLDKIASHCEGWTNQDIELG